VERLNPTANYLYERAQYPQLALSRRLLLRTAVVMQSLTPEQIKSYLTSGGERLEALRETLREDADLLALASTPFMLLVRVGSSRHFPGKVKTVARKNVSIAAFPWNQAEIGGMLNHTSPRRSATSPGMSTSSQSAT
jgi:hypothetical protein